jgi:hypothetical protein
MSTIRTFLFVLAFLAAERATELATGQSDRPATSEARPKEKSPRASGDKKKESKTEKIGRGKFTVSKETTYVTEPLDKDGYIDYSRALNKRLRQGVTPENNANVLIWKALGPHPEKATMPEEFFQLMGMQPPPEKGEYFSELTPYLKEQFQIDPGDETAEIENQLDRCTQRPWTTQEYPKLASWLEANEKPLALVIEATKRPQYFSPIVPPKTAKGSSSGIISALMPGVQKCRALTSALAARAMLRAGQGAEEDAWQDLLACHRLGRLVGRKATLIEGLVGMAIQGVASKAELAFLDHTKADAKRVESYLRDLQKLPPLPPVADNVDLGERLFFLDSLMMIDRHGMRYLEGLTAVGKAKEANPMGDLLLKGIDWDPALQNGNKLYDRMAAAMREKDRGSRQKKLEQIDADMKALKAKVVSPEDLSKFLFGDASARGKAVGDMMICLVVPAVLKVHDAGERIRQEYDNLLLAFALAWYQRGHGRYPKKLDELAPKYLAQVSSDLFSGKPLIYRPSKNGYLLYSVGVNGKDEEGRGREDDPPGDDLSVRMPLPKLPRQ